MTTCLYKKTIKEKKLKEIKKQSKGDLDIKTRNVEDSIGGDKEGGWRWCPQLAGREVGSTLILFAG